ncbi:serine/threonine-protein kinase [Frigoriglobus tundricola]|uniref:Uncharacterized protein n=1 Tax=Frigoriglobus tundricola TaxID=2774151 RepID=A0A6M5YWX7_9BACT|nr:hypothetical protein [Frigoriglobus tundricola]QJW98607.1 hypothetical protein FTUN_6202 [Frigoriglobus tundricola]
MALAKRCLAPDKAGRPADAGEVARAVADLRAAADERVRRAELDRARAAAEARAEWQKRRTRLAVAASVLGLLVVGGGGWLAVRTQAAERRTDADGAANVALGRAEQLAAQAAARDPATPEEGNSAVAVWEQAAGAVAQAAAVAGSCSAGVAGRVSERAAEVGRGLERARRDAALLAGLAAARWRNSSSRWAAVPTAPNGCGRSGRRWGPRGCRRGWPGRTP